MNTGRGPDEPSRGARIEHDAEGGATVWLDGQPQSYVSLSDPGLLAFEYVQHLGVIVDALVAEQDRGLRVTHVGGAGLTLARYVQHIAPGSPQIVLEPDAAMTELVRRELPLPRGHRIRVRAIDGRHGVAALADASADLIVVDAFAVGSVPAQLTTREFLADAARVLTPGGLLALNLPDEPGRGFLARVLATLAQAGGPERTAYGQVAVMATHDVLKGRRFGNHVVVAGERLPLAALQRAVARSPFPTGIWAGEQVTRLAGRGRPLTDADPASSPPPPDPGRWRAR